MKPSLLQAGIITNLSLVALSIVSYFIISTYAEISSPAPQDLTDLEKSKMQTIYEDDKKKVMLPYDPDKVAMFMLIAIIFAFISGVLTGYAGYKYLIKPKSI